VILALVFFFTFAIPIFFASWRLMLASLGVQTLVLALVTLQHSHDLRHAFAAFELGVVRGVFVPTYLAYVARSSRTASQLEVLPGNLLHWTLAFALVVGSATFAAEVSLADVPRAFDVAASASEVLIGLFILSTQRQPLGQAIGALSLENGVVFLETRGAHHLEVPVQVGIAVMFLILVLQLGWFLRRLGAEVRPPGAPATNGAGEVL